MTEKRRKGRNLMYNVKRCEEEEERDTEKKKMRGGCKNNDFVTTMLSLVRVCYLCAWSIRPYFYEKNGFTTIRYNLYFNKN